MVYMVADTGDSFYQAAMADIYEMTEAIFDSTRIKVVVHADAPSPWAARCWEVDGARVVQDGGPPVVKRGYAQPSGSCKHGKSLLSFVARCIGEYSAKYYLLVLWGHGEGIDWKAKVLADLPASTGIIGANKRMFPGSEGALEIGEIGMVLKQLKEKQAEAGIYKENVIIGFDACLMAMVEVYYEIQDSVGWVVAPNDEIPYAGWPYKGILDWLGANSDKEPENLAREIVELCKESYSRMDQDNDKGDKSNVSFSACNLARCVKLTGPVEKLAKAMISHLKKKDSGLMARDAIKEARDFAEDLKETAYMDLHAFCQQLSRISGLVENAPALKELGAAAAEVADVLKVGSENFVIEKGFSDEYPHKYIAESRAVSICFPESPGLEGSVPGTQINLGSYEALDFSKDTKWHAMWKPFWEKLGDK